MRRDPISGEIIAIELLPLPELFCSCGRPADFEIRIWSQSESRWIPIAMFCDACTFEYMKNTVTTVD